MTTVTLGLACWGEQYGQFLPEWWDAVLKLERKPDEIILAHGVGDKAGLVASIPAGVVAKVIEVNSLNSSRYWNELINACSSEWLIVCPSDDRLLPEALNDLENADNAGADLIVDAIRYKTSGRVWKGSWDPSAFGSIMTAPQLSICRKNLYERVGGIKENYRWSDWIFHIDVSQTDAVIYFSDIVRMVFDEGFSHETESGRLLPPEARSAGDQQVRDYVASLQVQ